MNKFKIFALLTVAAFVGEAVGVVRANHSARRIIKSLKNRNKVLDLRCAGMRDLLDSIYAKDDIPDATRRFNENQEFIDIIKKEM